jgi:hypothetical protein
VVAPVLRCVVILKFERDPEVGASAEDVDKTLRHHSDDFKRGSVEQQRLTEDTGICPSGSGP